MKNKIILLIGSLGLLAAHSFPLWRKTPHAAKHVLSGILGGVMLFVLLGLTPGTDVKTTTIFSGTLITARLATEYNRDVLTVPGSIFSAASAGTNFLLRQGATPITCANDLLQALGLLEENKIFPFDEQTNKNAKEG